MSKEFVAWAVKVYTLKTILARKLVQSTGNMDLNDVLCNVEYPYNFIMNTSTNFQTIQKHVNYEKSYRRQDGVITHLHTSLFFLLFEQEPTLW